MIGPLAVDAAQLVGHGFNVVLVIVVATIAYQLVRVALRRLSRTVAEGVRRRPFGAPMAPERLGKRMGTVEALGVWVARIVIVTIALLTILREFGIDVGPAIAGLGIAGIAISLGAQSLVKDYLNGMLIVFEQQFDMGDLVLAAGVSGTVEEFSLRRTRLRDEDGVVHDVPNSAIVVVSNLTRSSARLQLEAQVPADAVAEASQLIDAAGRALAADPAWQARVLEAPIVVKVGEVVADGVTLTVRGRVRLADQGEAAAEFRRRLGAGFEGRSLRLG